MSFCNNKKIVHDFDNRWVGNFFTASRGWTIVFNWTFFAAATLCTEEHPDNKFDCFDVQEKLIKLGGIFSPRCNLFGSSRPRNEFLLIGFQLETSIMKTFIFDSQNKQKIWKEKQAFIGVYLQALNHLSNRFLTFLFRSECRLEESQAVFRWKSFKKLSCLDFPFIGWCFFHDLTNPYYEIIFAWSLKRKIRRGDKWEVEKNIGYAVRSYRQQFIP